MSRILVNSEEKQRDPHWDTVINYQKVKNKEKSESSKTEAPCAYKESSIRLAASPLLQKLWGEEGSEMTCLKYWKKNIVNQ